MAWVIWFTESTKAPVMYLMTARSISKSQPSISSKDHAEQTLPESGTDSARNAVTYVFKGYLAEDATKGLFTIGMEELNNSGCSTKLTIDPVT